MTASTPKGQPIGLPPREALAPDADTKILKVGIVGAGIGGLAAAMTLLADGHDVEIFERSESNDEYGAAISTPPNSTRILRYYGFDFVRSRATLAQKYVNIDPRDISQRESHVVADFEETYGAPWWFFHRSDLHSELKRVALHLDSSKGNRATLRLSNLVVDVTTDGLITLADGKQVQKDLVVAADGVRSAFISKIHNEGGELRHLMDMARFLIPSERLVADPISGPILGDEGLASMRIIANSKCSLVFYGCRGELIMSISLAENVGRWKLCVREPLQHLARGRLVVIGDAAHPMPPVRAQGASMAIEDAGTLGVLFSCIRSRGDVEGRLRLYNELRVNRVAAIQTMSAFLHWDPDKLTEKQVGYFEGNVPLTPEDLENVSYSHNAMGLAYSALQPEAEL
ncbi:uncharacterized protein JN550_012825 [Neoarthrinium moseri]|uniref:uncharacterized protein n=1 Tax=Neoarthrinium moseri TaxID=1658444 RepID=UPI001FDBB8F3|nr:uncharacterized protein JN550_012825 [Neoarthrinium moseri]KAI1858294.1 hypothetical protein JN550_012825 [Neoarthrinium moseri]